MFGLDLFSIYCFKFQFGRRWKNINTINFVIAGDTLLGSFVENNYIRKVNNKQKNITKNYD